MRGIEVTRRKGQEMGSMSTWTRDLYRPPFVRTGATSSPVSCMDCSDGTNRSLQLKG